MKVALPGLLLLACEQAAPPDPAALDRQRYSESAGILKQDPARAAALCLEITDPVLEGECATFAAKELAGQRGDPLPICEGVAHSAWQQVCFFEASDGAGLTGEVAIKACQRSGEFIERCLSHALGRHADREWRRVAAGEEPAFLAWLDEQVPVYGLESGYQDIHRDFLARRIASRIREVAPEGRPIVFSTASCGQAPADTCTEVYRQLVRAAARNKDLSSLCAQPVTVERVAAEGLPTWPEGEPAVVEELWRRLCREMLGAGRPPPHLPPN